MNVVTLVLPKDMRSLEEKYAKTMADIVSERLTSEELEFLILQLEKKNANI